MISLGRVAKNLQWGVSGVAVKNFVVFAKIINFGYILIEIIAFEMCWHKN